MSDKVQSEPQISRVDFLQGVPVGKDMLPETSIVPGRKEGVDVSLVLNGTLGVIALYSRADGTPCPVVPMQLFPLGAIKTISYSGGS